MKDLLGIYNRNRYKIWSIIIIVLFGFLMLNIANTYSKKKNMERQEEIIADRFKEKPKYEKQSESLVSGGKVSKSVQETFGKLLDEFLTLCKNHESERAYGFLSSDCKRLLYPNLRKFEVEYCNKKFKGNEKYNFQSWISNRDYIYIVKIYEDMLTTGKSSDYNGYVRDYITVVKERGEYKLNINNFIKYEEFNKIFEKYNLIIKVSSVENYMDYKKVKFNVENKSKDTIIMDSIKESDSIYLVDNKGVKYIATTFENEKKDFIVGIGEKKTIEIKFANPYLEKNSINKYIFNDVYLNKEMYKNGNSTQIELNMEK